MRQEFGRFLIVGGLNTALTLVLYWALLTIMHHYAAYGATFIAGVLFSWWMNSRQTFRTGTDWRKLLPYGLFYFGSWLFGQLVLMGLADGLGIDPSIAIFGVILVSLPVNFIGSRLILRGLDQTRQTGLSANDLNRLVSLHMEALPTGMTTRLGAGVTGTFYRFVESRDHDFIETIRDDQSGDIIAAAMVTADKDALNKDMKRDLEFLLRVGLNAWKVPLSHLLGRDTDDGPAKSPELVYLFTDPDHRSKGLGRQMIERLDRILAGRGFAQYYVITAADPANRALAFYDREGFQRLGTGQQFGNATQLFVKNLAADRAGVEKSDASAANSD